jgi:PEP-CTERM motif
VRIFFMSPQLTNTKQMLAAALMLLSLVAATSVQAGVIYSTGFEPPAFVPGPINGQDGWSGAGEIQGAVVYSGTQALHIDASTSEFQGANLPLSYAVGSSIVSFQVEFQQTGPGTAQAGISLVGDTGFLAQIYNLGGNYGLGNYNMSTPRLPFASGTWHLLDIILNFKTETMVGYVDGQSLGTLAINPPSPPTQITELSLYSFGSGGPQQDVYFDNVSLATVPEPSSLVLGGTGLVALAIAHLRKRLLSRSPGSHR